MDETGNNEPIAYDYVNQAYNKAIEAGQSNQYAYAEADDAGGESLQNFTKSLADKTLEPLMADSNVNPVQASIIKEQIGLKEPNKDQIVDGRYSESGQYQIGKLERKFNAMKHLYEDVMFAEERQKENIMAILKDYVDREILTQEEADLFSKVRNDMIDKKEGADVESIFLAIDNNASRIGYLKREFDSGRVNTDILRNLITEYGLPLSEEEKRQFGIGEQ